jgi:hypothetical protein
LDHAWWWREALLIVVASADRVGSVVEPATANEKMFSFRRVRNPSAAAEDRAVITDEPPGQRSVVMESFLAVPGHREFRWISSL